MRQKISTWLALCVGALALLLAIVFALQQAMN